MLRVVTLPQTSHQSCWEQKDMQTMLCFSHVANKLLTYLLIRSSNFRFSFTWPNPFKGHKIASIVAIISWDTCKTYSLYWSLLTGTHGEPAPNRHLTFDILTVPEETVPTYKISRCDWKQVNWLIPSWRRWFLCILLSFCCNRFGRCTRFLAAMSDWLLAKNKHLITTI